MTMNLQCDRSFLKVSFKTRFLSVFIKTHNIMREILNSNHALKTFVFPMCSYDYSNG